MPPVRFRPHPPPASFSPYGTPERRGRGGRNPATMAAMPPVTGRGLRDILSRCNSVRKMARVPARRSASGPDRIAVGVHDGHVDNEYPPFSPSGVLALRTSNRASLIPRKGSPRRAESRCQRLWFFLFLNTPAAGRQPAWPRKSIKQRFWRVAPESPLPRPRKNNAGTRGKELPM